MAFFFVHIIEYSVNSGSRVIVINLHAPLCLPEWVSDLRGAWNRFFVIKKYNDTFPRLRKGDGEAKPEVQDVEDQDVS